MDARLRRSTADIFDAFARTHDATSTPGAIGLGLTISRSLAEGLGGTLTHAREGDWTAFTLSLPATEVD